MVLSWQDMDVLEAVNKDVFFFHVLFLQLFLTYLFFSDPFLICSGCISFHCYGNNHVFFSLSLCQVLNPLQDLTDALSGEQHVSVSNLKPVLHLFNAPMLAEEDNGTELTKDVKGNILGYLNYKYSDPDTGDLLDIASLRDPQFETTYTKRDKVQHIISRAVEDIKSQQVNSKTLSQGHLMQQQQQGLLLHLRKTDLVQLFQKAVHQQHGLQQNLNHQSGLL